MNSETGDEVVPAPCGVLRMVEVGGEQFVLPCNRPEWHEGAHKHWALGVVTWAFGSEAESE
jgi:hypothetical protein